MVARTALCTLLLLVSTQAQALCRDEVKDLKPRIDRAKEASPQRYALAVRWWNRGVKEEPYDQLDCLNDVARARKTLSEPLGANEASGPVQPVAPLGAPAGQR